MADDQPTIPVAIDAADLAELERWAANEGRTVDALLKDAVAAYLAAGRRWIAETELALDDVRQGRAVPHEQIVRDVAERRSRFRSQAAE